MTPEDQKHLEMMCERLHYFLEDKLDINHLIGDSWGLFDQLEDSVKIKLAHLKKLMDELEIDYSLDLNLGRATRNSLRGTAQAMIEIIEKTLSPRAIRKR
jgi:hypothetical protein